MSAISGGHQLEYLPHQVGVGIDDDDGVVVLARGLAPQLVVDDVLDQGGLAGAGTAQDDAVLPYGGLGQADGAVPGHADQWAGVLIAGAEIAQEGDQRAGGDALHGRHFAHAQGQVPDRGGLPCREDGAAGPLRVEPVENPPAAHEGMVQAVPVQGSAVVPGHSAGVPGVARRIVEGTEAVDDPLDAGPGQLNVGLVPVDAHHLEFGPEAQGLQLVLHQGFVQVGPFAALEELPPDIEAAGPQSGQGQVEQDQAGDVAAAPEEPVHQPGGAQAGQSADESHAGAGVGAGRTRPGGAVVAVPAGLHELLPGGVPVLGSRAYDQPDAHPVRAGAAGRLRGVAGDDADDPGQGIELGLLHHPVLQRLQGQVALPEQAQGLDQRVFVLVQEQPVAGVALPRLSGNVARDPGCDLGLGEIGVEHAGHAVPLGGADAVAYHPVRTEELQGDGVPGVSEAQEQVLHGHEGPAAVLGRDDLEHRYG